MALPAKIPVIDLFTGDMLPILEFGITKSDGSGALDLTGSTEVRVKIRLMGGTVNEFIGTLDTGTVAGAATLGTVQYALPGTLSDVGDYFGQVEVTFGVSGAQSTSRFQLHVSEGL